ncbi:MAG: hypothetical protein ACLFVU_00655 [Phycisphaerae bacterium]
MELNVEIVKTVIHGIVWIVALVVLGRLGMFIATKYFAGRSSGMERRHRQDDSASRALNDMKE